MSPGNPVPQYYAAAPAISVQLRQSTDGGLHHGGSVSPLTKHLRMTTCLTATATALPMRMLLLDYLLFYPFIDEGTTDEQILVNSLPLPRWTDGKGVQIMAVSVASRTGGSSFFVTYTNSDGVAGRISKTVIQNTFTANGNIVTSQRANALAAGPFIPLKDGDSGVRLIESITMLTPDVGLFTLVLVKPTASTSIRGNNAAVEMDYFLHQSALPVIQDDAYLNFICLPQGSLAATAIHGDITTVWG